MRLIFAAIPHLNRLLRPNRWLVTATFLGLLAALECVGPAAQSDLHDALAALVLLSGICFVIVRHKRQPIPWLGWMTRRIKTALQVDYQVGQDFRSDPPYPARLPPGVWGVGLGLLGLIVMAGLLAAFTPEGVRAVARHGSYVVYLAGLCLVWVGLMAGMAAGFYLPGSVYTALVGRRVGRGPGTVRMIFLASYLLCAWSFSRLLPPIVPLILAGLGLGIVVYRLSRRTPHDAAFLWRSGPNRPITAVPLRLILATLLTLVGLIFLASIVAACGPTLLKTPDHAAFELNATNDAELPAMVLTPALGIYVAWLMPGAVVALAAWLAVMRGLDPSARTVPTVSVRGDRPAAELLSVARAVSAWGWRVRRPGRPVADVAVQVVAPDQSEATAFDAGWPLKISVQDLADPIINAEIRNRLIRRDELTLRRAAIRSLRTLMERGIAERKSRGGSFQFAPHWWFFDRMTREEPRRGRPRPVGPPFQRLFGPRVRQHLHEVLRAVQIDIFLVEDGIGPRRVARVFKAIFELYDKHRGTRRAEDHLLRGVPKVRMTIHDYAPENPFQATRFAEPHLDGDLDRARVLHLFRDSGGDEVLPDDPYDFSWEPAPSLGIG